jgi:nicotinamide-nucleotide adenylyltransferase
LRCAHLIEALQVILIPIPFPLMTERFHDFQLLSRYHAIIEEIRGNPAPRILLISRPHGAAERPEKEVGIFPSSFNPITNGHMVILKRAAGIKAFKEILLMLDTQAMDKEIFGATLEDRLLMLQVLFEGRPRFSIGVSNRGLFLPKAELLKEMYPKGTDITFIVGYDTLVRVFDPKYYEDPKRALDRLFACCTFMVTNRRDHGRQAFQQLMASGENWRFAGMVKYFEIPSHEAQISSSQVRQGVRKGRPFAHLVPSQVKDFVEKVKGYGPDRAVGPQGQRVNPYDLRTQVLRRLYALYPRGRADIDVGRIVNKVVEGMRNGRRLDTLLDSVTYMPMTSGRWSEDNGKGYY